MGHRPAASADLQDEGRRRRATTPEREGPDDLENDPNEDRNLFDSPDHAEKVAELTERLLLWLMRADETDQIAPRWQRA